MGASPAVLAQENLVLARKAYVLTERVRLSKDRRLADLRTQAYYTRIRLEKATGRVGELMRLMSSCGMG